jgi:lysozyme
MYLSTNYNEFILETYQKEFDMIIESKIELRDKFIKLLKFVLRKGYKYRRKVLIYGLASLVAISSLAEVTELFANDDGVKQLVDQSQCEEVITSELDKMEEVPIREPEEKKVVYEKPKPKKIKVDISDRPWVMQSNISDMKLSQAGWDYIRYEEGSTKDKGQPVLKAYSIGDGMITIGWGHAEKSRKSQFNVGDEITYDQAYEFLKKDLKTAADGVRRIFSRWEEKGVDVKISQDQFDVLVSLAYNSGVGSVNKSSIIRQLKKGNYEKAGEKLKSWRVRKKFPGLQTRRDKEYVQFMSYKTFE